MKKLPQNIEVHVHVHSDDDVTGLLRAILVQGDKIMAAYVAAKIEALDALTPPPSPV